MEDQEEDERKIILTDSEWISLLDGGDDSSLGTCCANVSALRDALVMIVRNGRNDKIMGYWLDDLKKKIKWVADGHELSPVLMKICEQIKFDPMAVDVEHEKDRVEL